MTMLQIRVHEGSSLQPNARRQRQRAQTGFSDMAWPPAHVYLVVILGVCIVNVPHSKFKA